MDQERLRMQDHERQVTRGLLMALHHMWVPIVDAAVDYDTEGLSGNLLQNRHFFQDCLPTFELESWDDLIELFTQFYPSTLEAMRLLKHNLRLLDVIKNLQNQSIDLFRSIDEFWRNQYSRQLLAHYEDMPYERVRQPPPYGQLEDLPPHYFSLFDSDGSELPPNLQADRRGLWNIEPVTIPLTDSGIIVRHSVVTGVVASYDETPHRMAPSTTFDDGIWEELSSSDGEPGWDDDYDFRRQTPVRSIVSFDEMDDRDVGLWIIQEVTLPTGMALETGNPDLFPTQSTGLYHSVIDTICETCPLCWMDIPHTG